MHNILRLTNYDDWEGIYLLEDNTWVLKQQGHHVQLEDVLRLVGISLNEYRFDFESTRLEAPPVITDELMDEIWKQNQ